MSDDKRERLRRMIKERSFLVGNFTLASGRPSKYFLDLKKTMFDPEGIDLLAHAVYDKVKDEREVSAVGGLEMGAVPIAVAVCMLSQSGPHKLSAFFVRKTPKGHGTDKVLDGIVAPKSTVVMLEDVTTTGGSVMKAVDAVRAIGCTVKKIVTVVDRLEGATEALRAQGLALDPIYTVEDLQR